ncbi:MAG: lytic transglycosylase domain-containing protein [Candidatus Hydrogenedentota bacterium]
MKKLVIFISIIFIIYILFAIGFYYFLSEVIMYYDIYKISKQYAIDPVEIIAIIQAESGFNKKAKSEKGALGLMQLLPETAYEIENDSSLAAMKIREPIKNLELGIKYLSRLKGRFQSKELALFAYHSGPSRVERWLKENEKDYKIEDYPIESTKKYVDDVYKNEIKWHNFFRVIRVFYPYLVHHNTYADATNGLVAE